MRTTPHADNNPTIPIGTPSKAVPWLVLLLAGAFEIGYALSVNGSNGFTVLTWSLSAAMFFLLTLFALSVALKSIDVGIGYAVWAGIGAVGASVLGPVFFDESLTVSRALWLAVIIGGVIWLKLADSEKVSDSVDREAGISTSETHSDSARPPGPVRK